jgi:ATP-dependent Lon protease
LQIEWREFIFQGILLKKKFFIAKKHLIKNVFKENGVKDNELLITDSAINKIIDQYTKESGVRLLEKQLSKIARKFVYKTDRNLKNDLEEDMDSKNSIDVSDIDINLNLNSEHLVDSNIPDLELKDIPEK